MPFSVLFLLICFRVGGFEPRFLGFVGLLFESLEHPKKFFFSLFGIEMVVFGLGLELGTTINGSLELSVSQEGGKKETTIWCYGPFRRPVSYNCRERVFNACKTHGRSALIRMLTPL